MMLEPAKRGKNEYKGLGLFLIGGDEASEFLAAREKQEIVII
jgi:hypothetical protein